MPLDLKKEKQEEFMAKAFLIANFDEAKKVLNRKQTIGSSIDGLLYAHILAVMMHDDVSLSSFFRDAIKEKLARRFGQYPALNEVRTFFVQRQIDKNELWKTDVGQQIMDLLSEKGD